MYFQSDITGAREYPVDQNNFTFPFWEVFPSALSELDLQPTGGLERGRTVPNDKNVWGDLCSLSPSRDSPREFHTWGTSSHGCGNLRSSQACTSVEHFPSLWKAIFLLHSFTQISLSKPILHLPPMGCHWSGSTVPFLFVSFETELCWLTGVWVLGSKNGF